MNWKLWMCAVMLVSVNVTHGGYTVLAQGMTWIECRAFLGSGAGAFIDHRGDMRQRRCQAEPGDPES